MIDCTPKQKLFVDYYLQSFNATDAARRAGYKGNDKTLSVVGSENLAKPCIVSQLIIRWNEIARKNGKKIIDTYEELTKNFDFVSKLRDACERWLKHPETDTFSIDPRGSEIDVVYFDYEDKDAQGNPKRKTESLQESLARLDGTRYESDAQFIKTADIRELALKTIDRIDTTLDKFARLGGQYQKDKGNEADALANAVAAYSAAMEYACPQCGHRDRSEDVIADIVRLNGKVEARVLRERVQELGERVN